MVELMPTSKIKLKEQKLEALAKDRCNVYTFSQSVFSNFNFRHPGMVSNHIDCHYGVVWPVLV